MMCEFHQAPSILSSPTRPCPPPPPATHPPTPLHHYHHPFLPPPRLSLAAGGVHTSIRTERRNILMLNRKERYEQGELKPGPSE